MAKWGINPLTNPLISRCENLKVLFKEFLSWCTTTMHIIMVHFHRQSTINSLISENWKLAVIVYLTDSNQNIWRNIEKFTNFYWETPKKCLISNQSWIKIFPKYGTILNAPYYPLSSCKKLETFNDQFRRKCQKS